MDPLRASDVRQHNLNIVLSSIYHKKKEGMSQSQLVSETGLRAPTIFRIFQALEEQGLIIPAGGEASTEVKKGRKPVSYMVNPTSRYIFAVEFWTGCLSIGLFDFLGERVVQNTTSLDEGINANEIVNLIAGQIKQIIQEQNISKEKVIGIGVAAPGQVDVRNRIVVFYPRINGMKDYHLAEILEEKLAIPVLLQNNCSALAYGEYHYGGFNHGNSMFTFLLRRGVNGALVTEKGIYKTTQGMTLETGHIPINFDGPLCACSGHGCLQAYIMSLDKQGSSHELFSDLDDKLSRKDKETTEALDEAANYLYFAMKCISSFFAPASYLLVCSSAKVSEYLAETISVLQKDEHSLFIKKPNVFATYYQMLFTEKGAVDLVVNNYLS